MNNLTFLKIKSRIIICLKLGKYEKLIKTVKDLKTFEHFDLSKNFRISGSYANFQNLEILKFRED